MMNKKITILALVLLIVAGIIVVGLKGFNVDFMIKQHDSIEYTINDEFEISDIENISKEVFGKKKFKIKGIELFSDAVSINAEKITTEEAENLVKKLDEKYKKESAKATTDETAEENEEIENATDYIIISNPKIKLFSLLKPYIKPIAISGVLIFVYVGFRYRKLSALNVILKLIGLVVITVLSILSAIAIVRFPISGYILPSILVVVLAELILFCIKKEKQIEEINEKE